MHYAETPIHSFVLKIWLEEAEQEVDHAVWRGHITHVPSGHRRYFKHLNEIVSFITPYLIVGTPPGEANKGEQDEQCDTG